MSNETTRTELNIEDLLRSKNFNNIVNVIIYEFGKMQDDVKNDIRQTCAIVVLKAIKKYNPELNDNFWVYCKPFMTEYAKRELNLQKNVVHIPYNHTNSSFKNYEKIRHEYQDMYYPDGNMVALQDNQTDVCAMMDIKNAIESLNETQNTIVKMRIGIVPTNNGKTDFTSIGESVGLPMHKARAIFIESQQILKKYLYEEEEEECENED